MLARFDDKIHLGSPHPEPRRRGYESNSHTITKIGQKTDFCYGAILRRNPNRFPRKPLKLSPDACGRVTPARPTRKTLCLIFLFPPRRISFLKLKRVFSGGSPAKFGRGVGASLRRQSRRATRPRPESLAISEQAKHQSNSIENGMYLV